MSVVRRRTRGRKVKTSGLADELLTKHRKMGISAVPRPKLDDDEFPSVPEDVSTLSDQDLSALYLKLDAFTGYVGFHLSIAEVAVLEVTGQLKEQEAKLTLSELDDAPKGKVAMRKLEVFMRPDLVKLRERETYHKAEVKMLKHRVATMERSIRMLSREQTRREKVHDRREARQP